MENPGETLVGDYLRHILECDFVDYNVYTKTTQGEIDVIGIKNEKKEVFICEVVTHLTNGLKYVKISRPDSARRLLAKFRKDIAYGRNAFKGFRIHYMLWSPVVKDSKGKKENNQYFHLGLLQDGIRAEFNEEIEFIINEKYLAAIEELRAYAGKEKKELKSPIMRFLQIEQWTKKNISTAKKPKIETAYRRAIS